jgi:heat shock protein HslJ
MTTVQQDTTSMEFKMVIVTDSTTVDSTAALPKSNLQQAQVNKTTDSSKVNLHCQNIGNLQNNGKPVKTQQEKIFYINLDSKQPNFVAYAGCNIRAYTMIAETKLAFSKIISKCICPNSDYESKFVKVLEKVDNIHTLW